MAGQFWENDQQVTAQPRGAPQPVLSIPDRPEKPTEPKTSWRTMTPEEARAQGLPENGVYQVSSQGEIRAVKTPPEKTDPSTPQGRRDIALSVLGAAGIDLRGGKDPVADLIRGSTSGGLQTWAARKYGSLTGSSTDGMMKIAQLETIGNDLVLKASGGSLGAQISNSDREFMAARFGDIANPEKTVDERLAAWEQVKQRLGYDAGIEMGTPAGGAGSLQPGLEPSQFSTDGRYRDPETGEWVNVDEVSGPVDGNDPGYMQIAAGVGDIVEGGINNTVGLVVNPINTVLGRAMGYEGYTSDLGQTTRDLLGLPEGDPTISAINQAATGGLTLGGGAAGAARFVPGMARTALAQYGVNPVGDAIVAGSAATAGEAARESGAGPVGQFAATLAGGMAPAAFTGRLARNAPAIVRGGPGGGGGMPRAVQPTTEGGEVIAAADRLNTRLGTNIEPMPADVGGPFIRRATGGGAQFPLAASPIISQAKTVSAETQAARDAIARIAGNAVDPENAGEAALSGATKYMQKSKTKVDALYAKARRMGGDELVDLPNARTVLDRNIAELAQTPGGATGLARMKALRAELDQPYPVEGIKRMRTSLRDEFISDGLRGSDVERRMKQVIDAADEDIAEGLAAAGKADAADAYREAAKAHRERVETIDEVLAPFIGRNGDRSGEQVFQAIVNSTAKNNKGLAAFMKAIPAEDAATVRASIIGSLGKSSAGRQDAEGMAFSAGEFLTHWNKLSPGAKSTLFGGELRAALDDLAKVAGGSKEAQKYANFSNTGSVLGITATGGSGAAAYAEPVTGGALLALQYVTGKMLASPKIARLIAKMPKDPRKARAHIQGLRKIAGAERAIAPEANYLFDQIANDLMVTGGPARLAAEPDGARGPERSAKPTTMPVPK